MTSSSWLNPKEKEKTEKFCWVFSENPQSACSWEGKIVLNLLVVLKSSYVYVTDIKSLNRNLHSFFPFYIFAWLAAPWRLRLWLQHFLQREQRAEQKKISFWLLSMQQRMWRRKTLLLSWRNFFLARFCDSTTEPSSSQARETKHKRQRKYRNSINFKPSLPHIVHTERKAQAHTKVPQSHHSSYSS